MAESVEMEIASHPNASSEPAEMEEELDSAPTGESARIVVQNLPKYFGFKQLKSWFEKIGLSPTKIKPVMSNNRGRRGTASACYLDFATKEEVSDAIRKICTNTFNGSSLSAKETTAAPDPFARAQDKRNRPRRGDDKEVPTENKRPPEEEILDIVTNLHRLTYPEQLIAKQNSVVETLRKIQNTFRMKSQGTMQWLKETRGQLCPVDSIRPAPTSEKYRNKCEFSIGHSVSGERAIGFKLGKYKEGVIVVVPPDNCGHINDTTKKVVKVFESFIRTSPYDCFNENTRQGYWHMLAVRTNNREESVAIIHFHPQSLEETAIQEEKTRLQSYCNALPETERPTFVYWVTDDKSSGGQKRSQTMSEELLVGSREAIFSERLLGYDFKISPDAFFQVNTPAAEVLYSTLVEVAEVTPNTIVLDLCCGTGTIGIVFAKHVKKVIGVELGENSIVDAKENAQRNNVENVEFICAKVEDVIDDILVKQVRASDDIVVVLDPPRSGVPNSVIAALRKCDRIRRILYVACAADNEYAMNNLYALSKARAKGVGECSYRPNRCVPVDMFPQTKNVELIFVFDRVEAANGKRSMMDQVMEEEMKRTSSGS